MSDPPPRPIVRFGVFEADLRSGELRKAGWRVPIQDQPFRILGRLLQRPGELVTREELRRELWPADTYVDFERALNAAVKRLRDALGDAAESPRFIETIPKRGYRFIAPVEDQVERPSEEPARGAYAARPARLRAAALALAVVVILAAAAFFLFKSRDVSGRRILLAVLPFQNLSESADDEYLADGITEELTTMLARLNPAQLGVISRSSVVPYKAQQKPLSEIGRELKVAYVLQGSARYANGRLRITAQLVEVASQTHLWADIYERELGDMLRAEADIADSIAARLSIRLLGRPPRRLPQPSRDAHAAYLQGLYFWNKRSEEGLRRAIELFRTAIELEPSYAQAQAGLATSYARLATSAEALPVREARDLAEAWARRALALEPELAEGHAALAVVRCQFDWNWSECEHELGRALALDPNYATGHHWLGEYLVQRGRFDEGQEKLRRARELDPISPTIHSNLGVAYMYGLRYADALSCYARALEIAPDFLLAHRVRGLTLVRSGRAEEGFASLGEARRLNPKSAHAAADLGYALSRAGRVDEARAILRELAELAKDRPVSPYDFAVVHAGLAESAAALEWLEKGYEQRAPGLRWLKVEPIFDGLRSEPRFQALLRRIALPD